MNACNTALSTPAQALAVVDFWRHSSGDWFSKSARFDRQFRERFLALHEAAASGTLVDPKNRSYPHKTPVKANTGAGWRGFATLTPWVN